MSWLRFRVFCSTFLAVNKWLLYSEQIGPICYPFLIVDCEWILFLVAKKNKETGSKLKIELSDFLGMKISYLNFSPHRFFGQP
jgi:hypothetical protein